MTNPDLVALANELDDIETDAAGKCNWSEVATVSAALRRLASSDGGVKVRELEWRDHSFKESVLHIAPTAFEDYRITLDLDANWPWVLRPFIAGQSNYQTLEAAKAAAQADYEARIRSALVEVPTVKGGPVAWLRHGPDGDAFAICDEDADGAFAVFATVPPANAGMREALELAYGLLWIIGSDRSTTNGNALYLARKALYERISKDGQARGITAAREAIAGNPFHNLPDPVDTGFFPRTDNRPGDASASSGAGNHVAAVRDDGDAEGATSEAGLSTVERLWNPFQTCSTTDNRPVELRFQNGDVKHGYFSSSQRRWVDASGTPLEEGLYPSHWRAALTAPGATTKSDGGVSLNDVREALEHWLDEQIASAAILQRNAYSACNDRAGEKYHAVHCALYEVKMELATLRGNQSDDGVEGHATPRTTSATPTRYPEMGGEEHMGATARRTEVQDASTKTGPAGIKPGPSDTTPLRPEVSVEDLRSFIYVRQPCTSEELARALLAKYHMKGRE